jgi:four helix bundle protein
MVVFLNMASYRDLEVWKKSISLTKSAYKLTEDLPSTERFGLSSQMQRAAVSVAANIAEGNGRMHRGDYIYHLSMAKGSLCELETLMILSVELGYLSRVQVREAWKQSDEVGKMLATMIIKLKKSVAP